MIDLKPTVEGGMMTAPIGIGLNDKWLAIAELMLCSVMQAQAPPNGGAAVISVAPPLGGA